MPRGVANHFNRGEIDQLALAREDLKRVNSSASLMTNFIPLRLGPMMYRPGMGYIGELDNGYPHHMVPFISSVDDTAIIDFYHDQVEFIVNDVPVLSTAVTSPIVNGTFASDIASWTDASLGTSGTSWYDLGGADGALSLDGDGANNAVSYQTIATTEVDKEHFLRVVIKDAPVVISIGTSGASSTNIFTGTLKPGEHVLSFTPDSNITITFASNTYYRALVDSVSFLGDATLALTTPLTKLTLPSLRQVQSIDVVFCAFNGGKTFQIESRGDKSWSIVDYRADDGPFSVINTGSTTLTIGALVGDTTLTSSVDLFTTDHIGALFKVGSIGQSVSKTVTVDTGDGTDSIRVFGVGTDRGFTISISGIVGADTVTLQRSADDVNWEDVTDYTADTTLGYNDTFDNAVFFYRLYVKAGNNPPPDSIALALTYASGSIEGIARVTSYTSATVVNVQVLVTFGGLAATTDWYEGSWSPHKQFPASVEIEEGRLWFGGKDEVWGSVSDAYFSFDNTIEGNSASILRTIGFGPVDPIKWIKAGTKLVVGTTSDELSLRSSSFGEILTPTNANVRSGSSQGSANVEPVRIDDVIYYVQRSGSKVYAITGFIERDVFDTSDINILNQTISSSGIVRLAVSSQPETRLFAVLANGDVAVYTVDRSEDVAGWSRITTDGTVQDVIILPETSEDRVYFVVKRTGGTYLEKMAKFSDAVANTFDSYIEYTSPGLTVSGLDHIEGEVVGVWANNQYRGTFTVSGGSITLESSYTSVVVGLPYIADYTSNKLSGYEPKTVLTERKRIVDTGVVLANYWPGSLQIGPSVSELDNLPEIDDGKVTNPDALITDYSELPFEFNGETEVDPRIHMRATGPCTILALTYATDYSSSEEE